MKNILLLNASINGEQGNSFQLSQELLGALTYKFDSQVIARDLAKEPLPHLALDELSAWMTTPEQRNAVQVELAKRSEQLINELKLADMVIIGLPMYNFGVPSTFKAWMDRVARAGETFRYTEKGPEGLLENKKVLVVAARGGIYQGTDKDSQTQHVKDFFALIGITDVQFVYAEGLNMPQKDDAIASARQAIKQIALGV